MQQQQNTIKQAHTTRAIKNAQVNGAKLTAYQIDIIRELGTMKEIEQMIAMVSRQNTRDERL